jgi:hypothetical protein
VTLTSDKEGIIGKTPDPNKHRTKEARQKNHRSGPKPFKKSQASDFTIGGDRAFVPLAMRTLTQIFAEFRLK